MFGVFAGWHYVFPRIAGYAYSDFLGKVHLWLCFIGANANIIVPTVFTRWIADDSDVFHIWNLISSIVPMSSSRAFWSSWRIWCPPSWGEDTTTRVKEDQQWKIQFLGIARRRHDYPD